MKALPRLLLATALAAGPAFLPGIAAADDLIIGFTLDADTLGGSLYEALKARGQMPVRALQRVHAGVATPEEASLLHIAPGSPLLRIERRSFLANGRPIEVTVSAYRGDRYDFVAELTLDG